MRFGGNRQVCAHRCQALLRHRRRRGRRGRDQRLYRHEQRGTGREEYLSPTKYV